MLQDETHRLPQAVGAPHEHGRTHLDWPRVVLAVLAVLAHCHWSRGCLGHMDNGQAGRHGGARRCLAVRRAQRLSRDWLAAGSLARVATGGQPARPTTACLPACARDTRSPPRSSPPSSQPVVPLCLSIRLSRAPRSPSLLPPSLSTRPALLRFASLCVSTAIVMRNWFRLRVWPTAQRPRGEEENKVAHTKRAALITANVPTSLAMPWPIGARRGRDLSGLANRGLG